jgi:hypothetical protein
MKSLLLSLLQVRCQAMYTFDDSPSFDRDHLSEQCLDPSGSAPSEVAFSTLGAHDHTRSGDFEAFRSRLMGFKFVFLC